MFLIIEKYLFGWSFLFKDLIFCWAGDNIICLVFKRRGCLLFSFFVRTVIVGLKIFRIKSSSCIAWFFWIFFIGWGFFIILRCTLSIIRRYGSFRVIKILDDLLVGCYRLWYFDLVFFWLRNKYSNLRNCVYDFVRVIFELFVCNLGFIGFFWIFICNFRFIVVL